MGRAVTARQPGQAGQARLQRFRSDRSGYWRDSGSARMGDGRVVSSKRRLTGWGHCAPNPLAGRPSEP
jgi:hypothetical protein